MRQKRVRHFSRMAPWMASIEKLRAAPWFQHVAKPLHLVILECFNDLKSPCLIVQPALLLVKPPSLMLQQFNTLLKYHHFFGFNTLLKYHIFFGLNTLLKYHHLFGWKFSMIPLFNSSTSKQKKRETRLAPSPKLVASWSRHVAVPGRCNGILMISIAYSQQRFTIIIHYYSLLTVDSPLLSL